MKYKQRVQKKSRVFDYGYNELGIYKKKDSYRWICFGKLFRYRFDPVPYTGKGRNSVHPCVRCMKTTQERRMWFKYKKYVRGKRSCNSLPNAWDDIWHARREKGWKRTKKKHQWEK